ncbi:MAG TPA: hypothetical protein DEQ62_02020 [Verrucomicrobiales bacterium]|nr:hypothetical protein [Verrucomicrobiales bacterium]
MKPILITTVVTGLVLGCETTQKSEGPATEEPRMQRQISDEELQAISDLHLAAEEGDLAKVKQCLKKGTNIDCVAGKASYRVLHKAVRAGDKKMVTFLIQQGAKVNLWSIDGTPLDFAIKNKHPEIERLLREHGGKTGKELEEKQK